LIFKNSDFELLRHCAIEDFDGRMMMNHDHVPWSKWLKVKRKSLHALLNRAASITSLDYSLFQHAKLYGKSPSFSRQRNQQQPRAAAALVSGVVLTFSLHLLYYIHDDECCKQKR
jgi:hypothetical protein